MSHQKIKFGVGHVSWQPYSKITPIEGNIAVGLLKSRLFFLLLLVLLILPISACGQASPPVSTPTGSMATASLPPTDTPAPSSTPTPEAPMAILLAPPDSDQATAAALQTMLTSLAAQAGLRFQVRPSLGVGGVGNVRIVVAIPPDPGLVALASSRTGTQFLAVGIPGLKPASNLSILDSQADRQDQLGFLAGYLAAVITEDWRVGIVSEEDTPAGKAASLGFRNGVTYFCGLCLPVYPPFPNGGYPVHVDLPAGAGPEDWQATITYLASWQVETVFVNPAVADDKLLAALAKADMNLIVAGPPAEAWREHWVASLGAQDPLQAVPDLWTKLLAGKGGEQISQPLGFTGVNPDLFSPGRQHLVETMLADLLASFIDTGVDPQTGESR